MRNCADGYMSAYLHKIKTHVEQGSDCVGKVINVSHVKFLTRELSSVRVRFQSTVTSQGEVTFNLPAQLLKVPCKSTCALLPTDCDELKKRVIEREYEGLWVGQSVQVNGLQDNSLNGKAGKIVIHVIDSKGGPRVGVLFPGGGQKLLKPMNVKSAEG